MEDKLQEVQAQLNAINDAVQILARNSITTEFHGKQLEGLTQRLERNEERNQAIDSIIHQQCDIKTKEILDLEQRQEVKMQVIDGKAHGYAWKYSGAVGALGLFLFGYLYTTIETKSSEHMALENRQESDSKEVAKELFSVLRDTRTTMAEIQRDVAVIMNNQKHIDTELDVLKSNHRSHK